MVHFHHTYQLFVANEPDSGDLDRCTNANTRIAYGEFYGIVTASNDRSSGKKVLGSFSANVCPLSFALPSLIQM